MKSWQQIIAILCLWIAPVGLGAAATQGDPKPVYVLYEMSKGHGVDLPGPLLPNRVYFRYDPELDVWQYVKTNARGMADPRQALFPGTVVAGPVLGMPEHERFDLMSNNRWVSTKEPEQDWLWIKANLPTYHIRVPSTASNR